MVRGPAVLLLKDASPEILGEWHPSLNLGIDPTTVTASSNRKVFWLGQCGHEWDAVVASRTRLGTGCPFCANQRVLTGFNDLQSNSPEIAQDWDESKNGLAANNVLSGGNKKFWWRCKEAHSYQRTVAERKKGYGCDVCALRRVSPGFNDLETKFPHLAQQWSEDNNGLSPNEVLPSSTAMAFWICDNGHRFEQSPAKRTGSRKAGCPYCSSQKLLKGVNDLVSIRPELGLMWDFERNATLPEETFAYSNKEFWWWCEAGHSWQSRPSSMKGSCPYCTNQRVWTGFNDLETLRPDLAAEWDADANRELASKVSACGKHKAHWICARGHRWIAAKYSRCSGSGCPYCSNKSEYPAEGADLGTLYPELLLEWDFKKNSKLPNQVFPSSGEVISWRCSLGHEFKSSANSRIKKGAVRTGCPTCAGRTTLAGFNDLATKAPEIAREWHESKNAPLQTSEVAARAKASYWWRCSQNHEWMAAVYSRVAGNGCPQCAHFGFKPGSPAMLYFIENTALGSRKIGITNSTNKASRVSRFVFNGWKVLHTVEHSSGSLIRELERRVLQNWIRRELELPIHLMKSQMSGIGGETETFPAFGPMNAEIVERIQFELGQLERAK